MCTYIDIMYIVCMFVYSKYVTCMSKMLPSLQDFRSDRDEVSLQYM